MKLIIEPNEFAMAESAMHIILGSMMQDKQVNISLTSGKSPIEMYKMMAPRVKNKPQFENVQYYLFDEAPWNDKPHGPNWDEMQDLFFRAASIPDNRIHSLDLDNWQTFDEEISKAGGIDVMVIGLGFDGHFCSNAPRYTPLDSYTYLIDRKERAKVVTGYNSHPEIPYSITMGAKSLMKVKHLVMIVNGVHKAKILKSMLDEPISNELPSTVLKLHPNFTVICDKDAASLLNLDDYKRL